MGLTPRARTRYKERLTTRRSELVNAGPHKIEPNRQDPTTSGVSDEDAQALSEMMQTLASSRNRDDAKELSAIDRALAKLRDEPDEFGVCEDCGEDIPERRLEVMPWAGLCTECQAKVDPRRNVGRKKITDYR
jgi:DnaK suppressor protein